MNNPKILIIDDEPQIRKLLQINLESNDYKVFEAGTAKEGILLAARYTPDLILLDIGLPDKNGHQVLQELRQWFNNPILILSVQDNEADIVSALEMLVFVKHAHETKCHKKLGDCGARPAGLFD